MQVIKSIGVLSCAKVMCAVYGAMGLIAIPILLVVGLAGMATGQSGSVASGAAMMFLAVLAPVFYGLMGFVFGALTAWIYNLAAKWTGGVQITLAEMPTPDTGSQIGLV